jgi:DNA anti-recombination protein RmuC
MSSMTDEERQLLENTANRLAQLIEMQKDLNDGFQTALLEIYRAQFSTSDHKAETLARLKLSLAIMEREGQGTKFMTDFIRQLESWTGHHQGLFRSD